MHLVVDGFNLIYKIPELEEYMYSNRLRDARVGLLRILESYSSKLKSSKVHVFFDGKKEKGNETKEDLYGKIQVYFSLDRKADDLIKEYIKFAPRPADLFVVTSDQEILAFAKRLGTKPILSEEFVKKIESALAEKPTREEKTLGAKLSPGEILYWKELFKKGK